VPPPACRVGDALSTVASPSLLIDLDAFEANLATMAAFIARSGVALRGVNRMTFSDVASI
jgi:D-serine deaminase-like pyridoxal phosphate-dependent protein